MCIMERALLLTAIGGASLYTVYLLVQGSGPKPVPIVGKAEFGGMYNGKFQAGSNRAPRTDSSKEPRPSGSASSVVTALASAVGDPTTTGRATELGGVAASTGDKHPPVTYGSLEEAKSDMKSLVLSDVDPGRMKLGAVSKTQPFAETTAALQATETKLDKIDLYHTDATDYVPP